MSSAWLSFIKNLFELLYKNWTFIYNKTQSTRDYNVVLKSFYVSVNFFCDNAKFI